MYVLHDNIVHHTSNRPPECKNFHPKYVLNGLISSKYSLNIAMSMLVSRGGGAGLSIDIFLHGFQTMHICGI